MTDDVDSGALDGGTVDDAKEDTPTRGGWLPALDPSAPDDESGDAVWFRSPAQYRFLTWAGWHRKGQPTPLWNTPPGPDVPLGDVVSRWWDSKTRKLLPVDDPYLAVGLDGWPLTLDPSRQAIAANRSGSQGAAG